MLAVLFNHFIQTQSEKSVKTTNAAASSVSSHVSSHTDTHACFPAVLGWPRVPDFLLPFPRARCIATRPRQIHHTAITRRSVTVRKWKLNRSRCSQSQMVSHSCCLTVECVIIYTPTPSHAYKYGWNIHHTHTHPVSPRVRCGANVVCEKCESDVLHGVSLQLSAGVGPRGLYHSLQPLLCVNLRGTRTHTHTLSLCLIRSPFRYTLFGRYIISSIMKLYIKS